MIDYVPGSAVGDPRYQARLDRSFTFDLETALIEPFEPAPEPACVTWIRDGEEHGQILPWHAGGAALVLSALTDPHCAIIGHNIAFDLLCTAQWAPGAIPLILNAFDALRVFDTGTIERTAEIAGLTYPKGYGLEEITRAHGIEGIDKARDAEIRLSYGPLRGLPLDAYSPEQVAYAIGDTEATATLFARQSERWIATGKLSPVDCAFLARRAFWLALTAGRGLRTDPERVGDLDTHASAALAEIQECARNIGFPIDAADALGIKSTKVERRDLFVPLLRADGSRNMGVLQALVREAYDGSPPLTDTGKPSTARATLAESHSPILEDVITLAEWGAVVSKDLPMLRRGVSEPIHTRFGMAATTRSTSSAPNVQNFRRAVGIRECVIPAEGFAFVAIDHSGLELATLAQWCTLALGDSRMADMLRAGIDLHLRVAAEILGITYADALARKGDDEIQQARGLGKVVNFGRAGFMGAETLVYYAKQSYGITITLEQAKDLIASWERANPTGRAYLEWIKRMPEVNARAGRGRTVQIPGTTLFRTGCSVAAAANCGFQGLGAALESWIGWRIAREQLTPGSALWGSFLCNFVHDEFILEVHRDRVTVAADRLLEIMRDDALPFLPDVPIGSEVCAMSYWSKKAKPKRAPDGRLMIWEGPGKWI